MELKRVVVTGIGAITPLGHNVPDTWKALINGESGSDLISHFDTTNFKTKFACEIKNYDAANYFDRKESRKMDRFAQYAMISAEEALKDSNIDLESVDLHRMGVILASGIGGVETLLNEIKGFIEGNGIPRFSPFFIPKIICDIAAGLISMKYGLKGPNYATVSACASSTNAIIDSVQLIRNQKADIIIAGGSEAAINEVGMGGFNSMQAISTKNDEYKTASRPFCATRDGFVMGEGSAVLILEEYEHAKARGAKIYAEIVGVGLSADAHHLTAPHPEGEGAFHVMKNALDDAYMNSNEVDYINVHGTATPRGDISELLAIKKLFGEHAFKMNISSSKSMTGHLLGAAGALEAIVCILSMRDEIVSPTINHQKQDPEIDERFNLTLNKSQKRKIKVAMNNTFGFGGHNTTLIFKSI
ncbi:MAG TPA: beta-ketoacyl-ACP synthase II [Bacteroidales bacterium]|jgi:3-oxoacyl-[acyl-carrier-protein] synthase II|nr:beta-ketoacyl-ACP synthase II [Bacteroidales bacterium]MDD4235294.1 beta-ketoacyl-ACP synthase II [Bacteroidales bacterium]MDY0160511.1 beta-ketoacyl-ACP synthase II [Bacteroidales bacterium]HXK80871.1 beta-ketoacyl-ACP synthase II [Bacteroidales bacterium]